MITKNSVVKIQNLVVNHKSRPVKSKTVNTTLKCVIKIHCIFTRTYQVKCGKKKSNKSTRPEKYGIIYQLT